MREQPMALNLQLAIIAAKLALAPPAIDRLARAVEHLGDAGRTAGVAQIDPAPTAQADAGIQACWRAGGGRWIYLGYASRSACVAEVFHGSCETVYGRWGQRQLRRYDGKLQIQGHGLFTHWSSLGPSECPATPQVGGQ